MAAKLTRQEACTVLGVDDWALNRLIELGEIAPPDPGCGTSFDAGEMKALADQRARRRAEALADLAALDGPFMGLTQ